MKITVSTVSKTSNEKHYCESRWGRIESLAEKVVLRWMGKDLLEELLRLAVGSLFQTLGVATLKPQGASKEMRMKGVAQGPE